MEHNPAAALRTTVEPVQWGGFESLAQVERVQGPNLGHVRLDCLDRAVKAEGVGDHGAHTAGGQQARDALRRRQARRQRLLDEQGFARPARRLHDGGVEDRRDRHDHGVHARVGHEITVVAVKRAAIRRGELLPFGTAPSADGDEGCVGHVFYDVAGVARPVLPEADQPDAEHSPGGALRGARASIQ
jgi:hypothetical protein